MYNAYNLKKAKECSSVNEIASLDLFNQLGDHVLKWIEERKFILEHLNKPVSDGDIFAYLSRALNPNWFLSEHSRWDYMKAQTENISKYLSYFRGLNGKVIATSVDSAIPFRFDDVSVTGDIILETKEGIEVIKLKKGKSKLSHRARVEENKPQNDIELFLLYKLGKFKYKDKAITGTLHHVNNIVDIENKNYDDEKNVISMKYSKDEEYNLTLEVNKILNGEYNDKCSDSNSCKKCKYSAICQYVSMKDAPVSIASASSSSVNNEVVPLKPPTLTKEQQDVVDFEKGIARVNAGAGSGKTTVVSYRVSELVRKGVDPSEIILLTFTNKGAEEMRNRIAGYIGEDKASLIQISTFNSWGRSIVADNYEILSYEKKTRLSDVYTDKNLLLKLLDERPKIAGFDYKNPNLNMYQAKGVLVEMLAIFNRIKTDCIRTDEEYENNFGVEVGPELKKLYSDWNKFRKEEGLIDHQDEVSLVLDLIANHKEVFDNYCYPHIMVDEFQDNDEAQMQILRTMVNHKDFKSLVVVGDDFQSIYGFRNARPENLINLENIFPELESFNIEVNFRSTPEIVNLAYDLISRNTRQLKKGFTTVKDSGEIPELVTYSDNEEIENIIVDNIESSVSDGYKLEDICIIGRNRKELEMASDILRNNGIPFYLDIPTKLALNNKASSMLNVSSILRKGDIDFEFVEFAIITGLVEYSDLIGMEEDEVREFLSEKKEEILEEFDELKSNEEKLNFAFGIMEKIAADDKVALTFLDNLKDLGFTNIMSLTEHLIEIKKFGLEGDIRIEDDSLKVGVNLITAHSSKGKEYPCVIVLMEKFKRTTTTTNTMSELLNETEEERRLLFVAITRAEERLLLVDKVKTKGGAPNYKSFYSELNEDLTEIMRKRLKEIKERA